ncbi:MAG: hypothetical protein ACF8PN_15695 [Phycisphaerales bacterium]
MELSLLTPFIVAAALTAVVALVSLWTRRARGGWGLTVAPLILAGYAFAHWRMAGALSRPVDSASEFVLLSIMLGGLLLAAVELSERPQNVVRWLIRFGVASFAIAMILSRYAEYYEWRRAELVAIAMIVGAIVTVSQAAALGIGRRHRGAVVLAILTGLGCASGAVFGLTGNAKVGMLLGVLAAALTPLVFVAHRMPPGATRSVIVTAAFAFGMLWSWGVAGGETPVGMAALLALSLFCGYFSSRLIEGRLSRRWAQVSVVVFATAAPPIAASVWAALDFLNEAESETDYSDYGY